MNKLLNLSGRSRSLMAGNLGGVLILMFLHYLPPHSTSALSIFIMLAASVPFFVLSIPWVHRDYYTAKLQPLWINYREPMEK